MINLEGLSKEEFLKIVGIIHEKIERQREELFKDDIKKCVYCDGGVTLVERDVYTHNEDEYPTGTISVFIDTRNSKSYLEVVEDISIFGGSSEIIKISYCPICGKNLSKED